MAARTFLILNGVDLDATQDEKVLTFLNLAEGVISEEELADLDSKANSVVSEASLNRCKAAARECGGLIQLN